MGAALVSWVASVLLSLLAMFVASWLVRQPPPEPEKDKRAIPTPGQAFMFGSAAFFFVLAAAFFAAFAIQNLA